jgi:hypothetical protein
MVDMTFKCDICGIAKGEANHWWETHIEDWYDMRGIMVTKFEGRVGDGTQHFCGEAHLLQRIGEYVRKHNAAAIARADVIAVEK